MAKRRGSTSKTGKEAAAAVAVAGAAAVGGKLAWEKLSGSNHDSARAYRLYEHEFVPDGIRRIARGQLDNAREELGRTSKRNLGEAVHETRKRLKRLRAVLRLARDAVGEETYRRENASFRDLGRRLSAARDANVLVETLDGLRERFADELPPKASDALRARLKREHRRALDSLQKDEATVGAVTGELEEARMRTADWTLEPEGFEGLEPGLRRIYRRGRRAMRSAAAEPTNENFHEWRKRVKDLWYVAQITRAAAPKRMTRLAKQAHQLSDLLGDDHDLAVLRSYIEAHPRSFDDTASRRALLGVLDRRRQSLQQEAIDLGRRVYKAPPKRFARSVERGWRRRARRQPQPAAA